MTPGYAKMAGKGNDMGTLFIIGGIALVVGVVTLLADGLFDLPESEWLSTTGLAAGVAMFCFVAGIMVGAGFPLGIAAIPGTAAALTVLVGTSWLIYRLRNTGDSTDTSAQAAVGARGIVVTAVLPGQFGEVDVTVGGEKHRLNAVADEQIPAQQPVQVVEMVSPTCARVIHLR